MKTRFLIPALLSGVVPLWTMAQTPGVTAKSILLGESAAFSGPAAQLGIQMNIGTKAYFDYVNAQGGVYGRKIELKTRDDKYEANLCAENTKKFIQEDKVFALISYIGTPTTVAAMPSAAIISSVGVKMARTKKLLRIVARNRSCSKANLVRS